MVVLLVALAIVAYLAKDALVKFGLLSPGETTVISGERPRSQGQRTDPTAVPPTPPNALERAKGLQETLKQESEKRGTEY
jgi:hypothetical protein